MTKEQFEEVLNKTPLKPVCRDTIEGKEVFFADGFIPADKVRYLEYFGVRKLVQDYPDGCYATLWYVPSKLGQAGIGVAAPNHDPTETLQGKQRKRLTAVHLMAEVALAKRRNLKFH